MRDFFGKLRQSRKQFAFFLAVLAFALVAKFAHLSRPNTYYFDEVYHAFTAVSYISPDVETQKKAYDPWAKPPEGVAYEWTHPPLSKLFMAGFMKVFGANSFGWRLGSVVFGTIALVLTAVLAFEIFGSLSLALVAFFLLAMETMAFTQSRIAMNDSYFIVFSLSALLVYTRWRKSWMRGEISGTRGFAKLWTVGALCGLALATKWTALYLGAILALDLCVVGWGEWKNEKKLPWREALTAILAIVVPVMAVYFASYIHYFSLGYGMGNFITLQQQMWWYHSGLKATHSYSSNPLQWIFNLKPVWMTVNYFPDGKRVANIYNLGNSFVLLAGLFAAVSACFKVQREKLGGDALARWSRGFLLFSYFMLWVPWLFSPRIMLFYHYLPAVPLLCVILAWQLELYSMGNPTRTKYVKIYLGACLVWFLVFFPHHTMVPMPRSFVDAVYFLIPTWR